MSAVAPCPPPEPQRGAKLRVIDPASRFCGAVGTLEAVYPAGDSVYMLRLPDGSMRLFRAEEVALEEGGSARS